jgi:diguanylate cyclase (GGDEF)-like protein
MTIFDVCHPDDLEWTRSEFAREVAGETDGYQIDNRLRRADGTTVWVRVSATIVRDDDGMPRYGVGLVADITEGHELTERLTYEATHDDLTGVSAPRVLQGSLEHHVAQAQRTGASVAVLLVDLDNFKGVNDAHGHAGGDAVLIETARRIEAQMRPADVVVRKGGDEFVIILAPAHEPGTTADVACLVARRIVDALAEPFTLPGGVAQIGASVGIALSRPGCSGPDALLAEADRAAYEAKRKGRGRYVLRELDRTG